MKDVLLWFQDHILTLNAPIPDKKKNLTKIFIFALFCGTSKAFMKALNAFVKPFKGSERIVKIEI